MPDLPLDSLHVCVAEAESMATVYPAARNLCAAVTYTRLRSLTNHAAQPHEGGIVHDKKEWHLFALSEG